MAGELQGRELVQAFISLAATFLVMAALLFVPAGTLAWALGWWFLVAFGVLTAIAIVWLWRVNPEIFAARSRLTRPGTKGWDLVLVILLLGCFAAVLVVAGSDSGRFHWSETPGWAIALGYVLLVLGYWGSGWAEAVNRHFEPTVRIQTERNHQVVTTGPYAYVRHPGYIFANLLMIGIALSLGSLWALVPVALGIAILAIRTNLEDATLQRELPGYAEFAQRTRFKWIPGVW
ncbi:MAG TPA: isoprenylcysteine carboxylmethyltransferase family protein [Devosiaceae bacterium]|nr:isoprenylcysteine carboxylmethyltransferase family protein [Devosiaceae bacterium]